MKIMGRNQKLSFVLLLFVSSSVWEVAVCGGSRQKSAVGGITGSQNSVDIENIGRFAVEEHNKKENSALEFVRVVKAKEQVVAGKLYLLTIEVADHGGDKEKKMYEAKVLVKPWMKSKQLKEFKPLVYHDTPSPTNTYVLGAKHGL